MNYTRCRECHEAYNPRRAGKNGFCAACAETEKKKRAVGGAYSAIAQACRIEAQKSGLFSPRQLRASRLRVPTSVRRPDPRSVPPTILEKEILDYNGSVAFLLSLRSQLERGFSLTERQLEVAAKILGD